MGQLDYDYDKILAEPDLPPEQRQMMLKAKQRQEVLKKGKMIPHRCDQCHKVIGHDFWNKAEGCMDYKGQALFPRMSENPKTGMHKENHFCSEKCRNIFTQQNLKGMKIRL